MNVFLVTSPFQYICANEAREVYQTHNNMLILIEQNYLVGQKQMSALLNEQDWDIILRFPRHQRTVVTPKIIHEINKYSQGNTECLFYSEYYSWRSKLIIRNLAFKKHVFFDDGTMTLFDYYDHIEPKSIFYRPRWLQDLQLRLKGIKPIGKLGFFDNTEIFSIFSFPHCVTTYRKNPLNCLKRRINASQDTLSPYDVFIGQGSVDEKGRISADEYLAMIQSLIGTSEYPLLYIPHRTEAKHVSARIQALNGLTYHQPNFPIEIELVEGSIIPHTIIGLSSTALYTLSIIYPNTKICLIEQKTVANGERDKRIYNYLNDYFSTRTIQVKYHEKI